MSAPRRIDAVVVGGLALAAAGLWYEDYRVVGVAWLLGSGRRRIVGDAQRLRLLAAQLRAEREPANAGAVRAERARIAVDLHDIVAHHISAIAVQANAIADLLADGRREPRRKPRSGR
ncbi:histidine kinase dimerization/phosphoacceptor domain-containing protein [Micromonospora sp. CPCC 206061]|uniref:histidine kinase dimerization/phosphoacceptor domain-containing protein n=1 Tax=Micromonospora sp. CPCC 206061 TaxID=3122410 RepID=UPI002FF2259A